MDTLDSKRWGVKTARIYPESKAELTPQADFVIARIDTSRLDLAWIAEDLGYKLCDTLTYWKGKTCKRGIPLPPGYWGKYTSGVGNLATECFRDYQGHYYADPRTRDQAPAIYQQWADDGEAYLIEHDREIAAFGKIRAGERVELVLGGVGEKFRGRGLYQHLVLEAMDFGFKLGLPEIQISTQITNLAVQKAWAGLGLRPFKSVYTFHWWK